MINWIKVSKELPMNGEVVLVFRPQVIDEDYTDKPICVAKYISKDYGFSCHQKPTEWARIDKPESWSDDMEVRQMRS